MLRKDTLEKLEWDAAAAIAELEKDKTDGAQALREAVGAASFLLKRYKQSRGWR